MGSGKLILRSIKKHGVVNFTKEILHIFDNELEMNDKEKELVVISENSYNLCEGGSGGFSYINKNKLNLYGKNGENGTKVFMKLKASGFKPKPNRLKISRSLKRHYHENGSHWTGRKHKEETKIKLKNIYAETNHQRGNKNSQYGTFWVTNGKENRKVKTQIPEGFWKGRTSSK